MQDKPTIQDIARRAGVGVGTVSRVLNAHPNVSATTRARVVEVIGALGYRPSSAARHLRTRETHVLALLTDEIATTPFAVGVVEGAERAAWEGGKLLFVANTGGDGAREGAMLDNLLSRQVDGVVYAAMYFRRVSPPPPLYEVPTVLLNCFSDDPAFSCVIPDEVGAGYRATEVLLEKGHRRIALINLRGAFAAPARLKGYRQALEHWGVPFNDAYVVPGDWTATGGFDLTKRVMTLSEPPTAIFCGNDRTAMGVYQALAELGLSVPADVAVMGFDNQEVVAAFLRPALTTMALPHYEMGRWAVNYLTDDTRATGPPACFKLPCPLVSRHSL